MTATASSPILSVKPLVLDAPERGTALELRVSAPATGDGLPVIVFSHGFGWSLDGYGPLTDHWAARGFVVVQPTHLDARRLGIPADDPRTPTIWRQRVRDADGRPGEDLSDARVRAGVLLAPAGAGGKDLSPFAAEHFPFMNPSFETLTTRALVVVGDRDDSPLTVRGPDWTADPYHLGPGAESLLTLFGGEHSLGGIPGWEVAETTDESPARVALVQRLTTAYLRHALGVESDSWAVARADLAGDAEPLGRVETK